MPDTKAAWLNSADGVLFTKLFLQMVLWVFSRYCGSLVIMPSGRAKAVVLCDNFNISNMTNIQNVHSELTSFIFCTCKCNKDALVYFQAEGKGIEEIGQLYVNVIQQECSEHHQLKQDYDIHCKTLLQHY